MLFDILQDLKIPVAYGHFKTGQQAPYLVYSGSGQSTMSADNSWYYKNNTYQLEYYFTEKDEDAEDDLESLLLENGYNYEKSEDIYIDDEDIYVIYYDI